MTTWLQCAECNEMFEVSNAIAEAMHDWRAESGDPFLCVECATQIATHFSDGRRKMGFSKDAISQRWTETPTFPRETADKGHDNAFDAT